MTERMRPRTAGGMTNQQQLQQQQQQQQQFCFVSSLSFSSLGSVLRVDRLDAGKSLGLCLNMPNEGCLLHFL